MFSMNITDIITASGVAVASLTFVGSVAQNRLDQTQHTAAQTREDLQAIIGESGRFLHPLLQESPYPILSFIQKASRSFMKLHDRRLVHLAKRPEFIIQDSSQIDQNKMYTNPIRQIEQETSLLNRLKQMKDMLVCLERDINLHEYQELCDLIESLKDACVIIG